MVFAHDTEVALQAAVALANSGLEPDTLESLDDLDAFFATSTTPAAVTATRPSWKGSARSAPPSTSS